MDARKLVDSLSDSEREDVIEAILDSNGLAFVAETLESYARAMADKNVNSPWVDYVHGLGELRRFAEGDGI